MIVLEYESIELDYCTGCKGTWLDSGELELLFGDRAMAADFLHANHPIPAEEKPRPCPECGRKMAKSTTNGPEPVCFDYCRRDHGMWFDEGELGSVLKHGSSAPGGEALTHWLRELFGPQGTR